MESAVEARFVKMVESLGGKSIKFTSPSMDALQDRLNLYPGGYADLAEVKDGKGKNLRPKQIIRAREFRELGFKVYEIKDDADILKYKLEHLLR